MYHHEFRAGNPSGAFTDPNYLGALRHSTSFPLARPQLASAARFVVTYAVQNAENTTMSQE